MGRVGKYIRSEWQKPWETKLLLLHMPWELGPYTKEDLIQPAHINATLVANGRGRGLNPYGNGTEKGKKGVIRKEKSWKRTVIFSQTILNLSPSSDEVDQFAIGFDGSSTGLIIGIWHIYNVLRNPP